MKKLFTLIVAIVFTIAGLSQVPQKMSYQAVIRNASGELVKNTPIGMKISILLGSTSGTPVYVETQNPVTNVNGLVSLEIGSGSALTGAFAAINWAAGPYFIKTETDPTGGTNYSLIATSQLLSVPYALYAKTAENGLTTGDQTIYGHKTFKGTTTILSPVNSSDAADKAYVDSLKQQIKNLQDNLISSGTFKVPDIDGNVYKTVKIGDIVWMAENLKTTKLNDGTPLNLATDNLDWTFSSWTPGYCWYNNDEATYKATYGALYNWYAVNTGKLCPKGWHVSSPDEWTNLISYIGSNTMGGKLKETGLAHWASPNTGATNETGFTALPGGDRSDTFTGLGTEGSWFSTAFDSRSIFIYSLSSSSASIVSTWRASPNVGRSVRCVQGESMPSVLTLDASSITETSATGGGNITSDGGAVITERGVCWNTSTGPTVYDSKISEKGSVPGRYELKITGLLPNTKYYVRAYAINTLGTTYGNEISFTTFSSGATVTDLNGNIYNTVIIGSQIWMKENLKTSRLNDGSKITLVTDGVTWESNTGPYYTYYDNDSATYKNPYGALYNWNTVKSGKLCPSGWHVPSMSEWTTLFTYLGGIGSGGKLKETGTTHWNSPNTGATNESGFNGLPGGSRDGSFNRIGISGFWWSSSMYSNTYSFHWQLMYDSDQISLSDTGIPISAGCSVRCLKD